MRSAPSILGWGPPQSHLFSSLMPGFFHRRRPISKARLDRARGAMELILKYSCCVRRWIYLILCWHCHYFMFEEERLETRPSPALVSSNPGPVVVSCSLSAHIHHVIDGAGAAQCFTARKGMDKIVRARLSVCQRFPSTMALKLEINLPGVQFSSSNRTPHAQLDTEMQLGQGSRGH